MLDIKCIVTIVERGKADEIVKEAKKAGASGATIFYGRGTGESEVKKFLKISVESSKEIILIMAKEVDCKKIMKAIIKAGELKKPGTGITFSLPIIDLVGLQHRDSFEETEGE